MVVIGHQENRQSASAAGPHPTGGTYVTRSGIATGPHPVGERREREAEKVAEVRHPLARMQVVERHLDDAVVLVLAPARDTALRRVRQKVPPRTLRCTMRNSLKSVHGLVSVFAAAEVNKPALETYMVELSPMWPGGIQNIDARSSTAAQREQQFLTARSGPRLDGRLQAVPRRHLPRDDLQTA